MVTTHSAIATKRYFTIGEVAQLCGVKPHVLRYWEQEFTQLRPMKRRGNRRYYQRHEVLVIHRIRDLLYDQGFTISGARNRLQELGQEAFAELPILVDAQANSAASDSGSSSDTSHTAHTAKAVDDDGGSVVTLSPQHVQALRQELMALRRLLDF